MTQQTTEQDLIDHIGRIITSLATAARNAQALADQHKADADRYRAVYEQAAAALKEIRDSYGHVCSGFDTCQHTGCRDSYAAWHVANEALGEADHVR